MLLCPFQTSLIHHDTLHRRSQRPLTCPVQLCTDAGWARPRRCDDPPTSPRRLGGTAAVRLPSWRTAPVGTAPRSQTWRWPRSAPLLEGKQGQEHPWGQQKAARSLSQRASSVGQRRQLARWEQHELGLRILGSSLRSAPCAVTAGRPSHFPKWKAGLKYYILTFHCSFLTL